MEGELAESGTTTAADLQKTTAKAQAVNFVISKEEAEAAQKAEDEIRKMELLQQQAYNLEGKSGEQVGAFKERLEGGEADLRSKMFNYLSQFNDRGDKAQ